MVPRPGAWLPVAALPVGVPFAIGSTLCVVGELADPWPGPILLHGLACIVFARYMWGRRIGTTAPGQSPGGSKQGWQRVG